MFAHVLVANSISVTRHKICNFPLPVCEAGREQVWSITTMLQISSEARETVGAFAAGCTGKSPGFKPVLCGLDSVSTYFGILRIPLSEPQFTHLQIVNDTTYFVGLMCGLVITLKVERRSCVMGKCGCFTAPCWIGSGNSDPGQYPCTECPLCSVLSAVGKAAYTKCLGWFGLQREVLENL